MRPSRESTPARISHLIGPLLVQRFLQDVDGFEANVDDGGRRFDLAIAQTADQIFDAMGDGAEALQSDLSRGAFDRVNRAEKSIDLFGIVVAFQRNQAIADDLQMLFGFRLEKFQNLRGDFVIRGQHIKVRAGHAGYRALRSSSLILARRRARAVA